MSTLRHLPNAITVARLLLVPPVAWALLAGRHELALWLFAGAGLSDGVDGALARRYGWTSRFGAIADPVADKMLMGTCFVVLALIGAVPLWLTGVVLVRDLVIMAGVGVVRTMRGPVAMTPTALGKLSTAIQVACVLVVLVHLAGFGPLSALAGQLVWPLAWLVAALAVASGLGYVVEGCRQVLADRAPAGRAP